MNKQSRNSLIKRVAEIEGLTNEEKSQLMELLRKDKAYGLVWEDKPETIEERLQNELPVLTEVKERAIISDNPEAPNHILIEGDNLEALTTLAYTHAGKIDVIYIDPPYNTGNNDFVYNDRFVDSNDSYRHSKWLSFMNKRLRIAKQLLSDMGVIFISIDDNEQSQLKLLCDEIFGAPNFIGCLPRITKKSGKDHSDNIAKNHDFILIYAKNTSSIVFNGIDVETEGFNNSDEYVKTRGKYKLNQTLDYDSLWYNPAMDFPIEVAGEVFYPGGSESKHYDRHNGIHNPKDWVWRWSQAKFDFGYKNGFVEIKSGRGRKRIYTKTYLNASIDKSSNGYTIKYTDRTSKLSSLAFVENQFSNDNAKKALAEVIDGNAFDFPKPTTLIKQVLELFDNDIQILDFFAGSGTTLHTTMQLNTEKGGKRQCILVTNNENNICEKVTYERNKRVINGYTTPNGEEVLGLTNNTLRYYRTDFVPAEKTNANKRALVTAATDMLCIKNDIYTEQELFTGRKLKKNIARYFDDGKKQMLIIYNELAVEAFAEQIRKHFSSENKLLVYVFSVNSYAYTDSFEEVLDKVELCALPDAIYKAYKSVIKPKRKFSEQAESIVEGFSELENEEMSNNEAE